jgi:hypothetical protein
VYGGQLRASAIWPRCISPWPRRPRRARSGTASRKRPRPDCIAAALGGGSASSWPLPEALADLFTRDQTVSAAKTRAHTSLLDDLTAV